MLGKISKQESFNDDDRKDRELELSFKRYDEKGSGLQYLFDICSTSCVISMTRALKFTDLTLPKTLLLFTCLMFTGKPCSFTETTSLVVLPTPGLQQSSTRQGSNSIAAKAEVSTTLAFSRGVLRLPYVKINDRFETMLRNLIAFEQLHGAGQEVTAYMFFMDGIVNTSKDTALLRENGKVKIGVGSDEDVANLFNGFTKQVKVRQERREDGVDVTKELNDYCSTRWHK
ncbi:uncharacterized protein A4U43_C05F22020 [Asparagus officinalis]|uniref:Uncharacterized protein n=1 Tax=Asparagus officinalis TaxID=4686 RepID=A0A5P1ETI7_ASPOF|nr:uncharacterized protein A4U43_C05F22020 [Asparagus officinalis]